MADTEDREKRRARERAYMRKWRAANPEKAREGYRAWYAANPEKARKAMTKWQAKNPSRRAYNAHKGGAKKRGITFLLTFAEWLTIWVESGRFEQRGRGSDQYCMARFGDIGPYAIGNVRICTNSENTLEGNLGKLVSEITRERLSISHLGKRNPHSEATRKRMSEAAKAYHASIRHLRPPLRISKRGRPTENAPSE